jgi:hypothetical protein
VKQINAIKNDTMFINKEPIVCNLYFARYHFTEKVPTTEWQGKQEIFINQGWYINICEMQHCGALSKDFRLKATTHKKCSSWEKPLRKE